MQTRSHRHEEIDVAERGARRRATFLGWFSVGLGLTQLMAPRKLARAIGVRDDEGTRTAMRALGARELMAGVGVLSGRATANWLWARTAGDVVDLALLAGALTAPEDGTRDRGKLGAATAAVVGATILDAATALELSRREGASSGVHVTRAVTVNRPIAEVFERWRRLTDLPRFMAHLESVEEFDGRSHWRAKAPGGMTVEWDAVTTIEKPNELIAWRSLKGADIPNRGADTFRPAPGNRGTEVRVEVQYWPPAGALGALVAKLTGEEPAEQIDGDLRRFKQVLETGDVARSDASIHRGMHPARPPESTRLDGGTEALR